MSELSAAEFGEFDDIASWRSMAGRLSGSDRKFVSIFDIVDRKVWLAVGGVFSRRHGAGRLPSKMMAFMSSKDACGRQCGKC
jgi:hypothetical protein